MRKHFLRISFLGLILCLYIGIAFAQPGSLDITFGIGGKVTTSVGNGEARAYSTTIQTDGKILAAGYCSNGVDYDFALVRYQTDGTLDNNFGSNGKVITDINANDIGYAVTIQNNDKILVAGSSYNSFALTRYNSDGSLDNLFGAGGKVTTLIGSNAARAYALKLQSDEKIIVAGCTYTANSSDFALCRYLSDGSLDNSFGVGGIVTTNLGWTNNNIYALEIQSDGKIVVAGWTYSYSAPYSFALARYNSDGTLDNTFGVGGKITICLGNNQDSKAYSLAIQNDGKIIAAGATSYAGWHIALMRFNTDGSLDNTFGNGGKVETFVALGSSTVAALSIQNDGKIVATGSISSYFGIARYNSNGSLDNTFGNGGITTTAIGSTALGNATDIQNDGKIIAVGTSYNGVNYDFALARYFSNLPCTIPVSGFTPTTANINIGDQIAFTDESTNNPTSWSWTFSGGMPATSTLQNPVVIYNTAGTYDVQLVATNACGSNTVNTSGSVVVTSCPIPAAYFTPTTTNVSAGSQIHFTDQSTNNPTSWSWTFGGGTPATSTLQNPLVTYNTAGTYDVQLVATNACGSNTLNTTGSVVINNCPIPVADFTPTTTNINTGSQIYFTDQSTNSPTSWSWTFGGGTPATSTLQNPIVTYNTEGIYDVQLVATNACGSNTLNAIGAVIVTNCLTPTADYTPSTANINVGNQIHFTDQSTNNPTSWSWTFPGGTPSTSTQQNPTVTYSTTGTYDVQLVATNACGSSSSFFQAGIIHVGNQPPPAAQVTSPNGGETWAFGSVHSVTATFPSAPGHLIVEVSTNNEASWHQIYGTSTASGSLSFLWTINYGPAPSCKIRVNCFYDDGIFLTDKSDATFAIISPGGGQPFVLNSNPGEISHLYWPFPIPSNWSADYYSSMRNGWIRHGEETSLCFSNDCDYGTGHHLGGDYYAQDWNQYSSFNFLNQGVGNPDCDAVFASPLAGIIIQADNSCNVSLCEPNSYSCNNNSNDVLIQSSDNPDFIFGVLHLKDNLLVSQSQTVSVGTPLGYIGSTGASNKSHAHCVLWKNSSLPSGGYAPPLNLFQQVSTAESLNGYGPPQTAINYSAQFVFDAVNPPLNVTPQFQIVANHQSEICFGDSVTLIAPFTDATYFWNTGDTTQSITVDTSGVYSVFVVDSTGQENISQDFIVTLSDYSVEINSLGDYLCTGTPLLLYPSLLHYQPGVVITADKFNHYQWSTGDSTSSISVLQPGAYSLTFTDGFGCRTSFDSITIAAASPPNKPIITTNGSQLICSNATNCTYQWFVNNYPIPNATSQTYIVDSIGSGFYYSVMITNTSGCSSVSDSVLVPTGIHSPSDFSALQIYPNPNNGLFSLHLLSKTAKEALVTCINLLGKKIYQHDFSLYNNELKTEINLSGMAKGLYLVIVTLNGDSYYLKVTITD